MGSRESALILDRGRPPHMKEDSQLTKFFDWVHWNEKIDPRLRAIFHVENERKCSQYAGQIRKQKGVRAGIWDVFCSIPLNGYHGLWCELKIKPNDLSQEQRSIGQLLHGFGYCMRVAWSGDEMIEIFKEYLYEKKDGAPL